MVHTLVDARLTVGGYNVCPMNFVTRVSNMIVRESFGQNYERLLAVKAKYDPTNMFSRAIPILPRT